MNLSCLCHWEQISLDPACGATERWPVEGLVIGGSGPRWPDGALLPTISCWVRASSALRANVRISAEFIVALVPLGPVIEATQLHTST